MFEKDLRKYFEGKIKAEDLKLVIDEALLQCARHIRA